MQKYKHVEVHHHGQTHTHAHCTQCEWLNEDNERSVAATEANKHCKETGHVVRVEKGNAYTLHPKD